jgi:hypothetical protein
MVEAGWALLAAALYVYAFVMTMPRKSLRGYRGCTFRIFGLPTWYKKQGV